MKQENQAKRLESIREGLREIGGVTALSRRLGVTRWWIYQVLNGNGTSARVVSEAERLIKERKQEIN